MSVCSLPHFREIHTHTLTHAHTEMRSDSVMNVSAVCPLALHAVLRVFVCVWRGARASVCVCIVRLLSGHWWWACCLIGWLGGLFTLYLCAQWRGTDPLQTVASAPDSHHTQTHSYAHTYYYSPCFGRPCYYTDTFLLSHFGRLTSWTGIWCS